MHHRTQRVFSVIVVVMCSGISSMLTSCGGSGGSGGALTAGVELPTEISPVSPSVGGAEVRLGRAARDGIDSALVALRANFHRSVSDLPQDSDYHNLQVKKFVEIQVLDVFDIIEQVFDSVRQTNHSDQVHNGWYKTLVAWTDEGNAGVTQTNLQEWYVRSFYSGGIYRVQIKILEQDPVSGGVQIIRAQADITQEPTANDDGTLADLGSWTLRASFSDVDQGGDPDGFFHATSEVQDDGMTRLTVEESFTEVMDDGMGGQSQVTMGTRAIVLRSQSGGYGKVEYPDWSSCHGEPGGVDCSGGPPVKEVSFSYNENYLSIDDGTQVISFDRGEDHEIVHRYRLFDGESGRNVEHDRSFGFSVRVDAQDDDRFGWYGAWQDRHELWIPGNPLEDGDSVVRNDSSQDDVAPTYTVRAFQGALARVELVPGSLAQLEGIPAEIWLWNDLRLRWNQGTERWEECVGDDGSGDCASTVDFTSRLETLSYSGDGDQRDIFVEFCGDDGMGGFVCQNYIYDPAAVTPGFYEATWSEEGGRWTSTGTPLDTTDPRWSDGELFCSVGGRTYIQYTGDFSGVATSTGWVEKTLTDFDFTTWTPTFDEQADREFHFDVGREQFVNNRGANLRVTRVAENDDADDYAVFMETQKVAKPTDDLSTVFSPGTVLVEPWEPDQNSKYTLNTDPESANYLLLEYAQVSEGDASSGIDVGDVVTIDLWGLRIDGDNSTLADSILFNWEYQADGEDWGGVTYLVDGDGAFVLLSEPIRLEPISLARTDDIVAGNPEGEWLSFSAVYDGHLHGLPDTWFELEKVAFTGEQIPAILANNVRIPDGTELTDAGDGLTTYVVKAEDIGLFLGYTTEFPLGSAPDLTLTDTIDLDVDLPAFTAPDIDTTIPDDAELLYIEGIPTAAVTGP